MHPYSALFPKPLMPLGDMPILELLLRRMKKAGIEEVILAVNHLRHLQPLLGQPQQSHRFRENL